MLLIVFEKARARVAIQAGEATGEGGCEVPERDVRSQIGYGDNVEEHRRAGANVLPRDERPERSGEIDPTTFTTLAQPAYGDIPAR